MLNAAGGAAGTHRRGAPWPSVVPALLSLASLLGGLTLAAHHPLGAAAAMGLFLLATALATWRPHAWLVVLPALLPVLALAPWSGWIVFEEWDLLVLAIAAAGYARMAGSAGLPKRPHPDRPSPLVLLVLLLMAASLLVSLQRGVADAGGFVPAWFAGYRESMNSVHALKGFFLALLMFPLWLAASRADPQAAPLRLSFGLMLGLGAISLAALWERVAFTGLLNFSTDYRTTALFWEMHVGGAALDGFLAITVPFAVRELLDARGTARYGLASAILLAAAYASLTTFSRGVYLGVPVAAAIAYALHGRATAAHASAPHRWRDGALGWLLLAAYVVAAGWLFPAGGYRATLALLGTMCVLLPMGPLLAGLPRTQWVGGVVLGTLGSALVVALAWLLPKGAYLMYAGAWFGTAGLLLWQRYFPDQRLARGSGALSIAGLVALTTALCLVALHWGGQAALWRAVPAALAIATLAAVAGVRRKAWPARRRWQGAVLVGMAMASGVLGVFYGGGYMSGRVATAQSDMQGRLDHWARTLDMLDTPGDWLFGKGLGRFADAYALMDATSDRPGDYRLLDTGGRRALVLTGGHHIQGWGEVLRLSQRVTPPLGSATVRAELYTTESVKLHFEVCEKHLLYNGACVVKAIRVEPGAQPWQTVELKLEGDPISRGAWYAPRLAAFSVAIEQNGARVAIGRLSVLADGERELLVNRDFSADLAHWFFTSDRHHLPWHAKNLLLHVFFEQGLTGLVLFCAAWLGAVWRVTLGHARGHPLAPAIAGALIGSMVVGMLDSLIDGQRLAFVMLLLVLLGLTLHGPAGARAASARGRTSGFGPAAAAVAVVALVFFASAVPGPVQAAPAQRIQVGPQRAVKTIADAALLARDGALVEVDAGEYHGDVAVWTQNDLQLRAIGGRVRLLADGAAAENKAIWVIRARNVSVQGFDFEGAAVASRNGAGIRFERGSLSVRDCRFLHNEMGLLTGNDPASTIDIENSEFAHNQRPDGHNHNLYVGTIARLAIRGSYLHHAQRGHLLKTRAAVNDIRYNRLTDETGGSASYELEFPNGGVATVVGNLIQQGAATDNPIVVSYGVEGYLWPQNELLMVHNTLIDERPQGGSFLRVSPGPARVRLHHNLLSGAAAPGDLAEGPGTGNLRVPASDFESATQYDYRLRPSSVAWRRAGGHDEPGLAPTHEYSHPRQTHSLDETPRHPGALQRVSPGDR
jgi:hypothetical protein